MIRPVEEITEWELQRICYNVREKVYNSSTVSPALGRVKTKRLYIGVTKLLNFFVFRVPPATSADRRRPTPKPTAAIRSARG